MIEAPTQDDLKRAMRALQLAGAQLLYKRGWRMPDWAWFRFAHQIHAHWEQCPELLFPGRERLRLLDPVLPRHWTVTLHRIEQAAWAMLVFLAENYCRNHDGEYYKYWLVERPVPPLAPPVKATLAPPRNAGRSASLKDSDD